MKAARFLLTLTLKSLIESLLLNLTGFNPVTKANSDLPLDKECQGMLQKRVWDGRYFCSQLWKIQSASEPILLGAYLLPLLSHIFCLNVPVIITLLFLTFVNLKTFLMQLKLFALFSFSISFSIYLFRFLSFPSFLWFYFILVF